MSFERILAFLQGQPSSVKAFALHREAGSRSPLVCRSNEGDGPEATAERFRARAAVLADYHGGQQGFAVGSFDENGQLVDSMAFRIGSDMGDMGPLGDDDPATLEGASVALMRTLNQRDTASRKLLGDLHNDFRRELAKKSARIEKLEAQVDAQASERIKWIASFEALKSEAHERRLKQIESMQDAKNKAWVIEQLAGIAPLVVSSLSGSSLLEKLLGTFSEPQLDAFLSVLNDEQRPMVQKLLQNAKSAQNAKARLASAG